MVYLQAGFNESQHDIIIFTDFERFIEEAYIVKYAFSQTGSERYKRESTTEQISDKKFSIGIFRLLMSDETIRSILEMWLLRSAILRIGKP